MDFDFHVRLPTPKINAQLFQSELGKFGDAKIFQYRVAQCQGQGQITPRGQMFIMTGSLYSLDNLCKF